MTCDHLGFGELAGSGVLHGSGEKGGSPFPSPPLHHALHPAALSELQSREQRVKLLFGALIFVLLLLEECGQGGNCLELGRKEKEGGLGVAGRDGCE